MKDLVSRGREVVMVDNLQIFFSLISQYFHSKAFRLITPSRRLIPTRKPHWNTTLGCCRNTWKARSEATRWAIRSMTIEPMRSIGVFSATWTGISTTAWRRRTERFSTATDCFLNELKCWNISRFRQLRSAAALNSSLNVRTVGKPLAGLTVCIANLICSTAHSVSSQCGDRLTPAWAAFMADIRWVIHQSTQCRAAVIESCHQQAHLNDWFEKHEECPACGCKCLEKSASFFDFWIIQILTLIDLCREKFSNKNCENFLNVS